MVDVNRIREMAADWLGLAGDAALGYVSRAFQWGYFRSTGSPWSACHRAMGLAPSLRWVFTGRDERRVAPDISDAFAQGMRQAEEAWSERLRAEQGRATPPVASAAATVPESPTGDGIDAWIGQPARDLAAKWNAHAGLNVMPEPSSAPRGPTLVALRELVAKWNTKRGALLGRLARADGPAWRNYWQGAADEVGLCIEGLCRVAGIEPPTGPTGTPGPVAQDGAAVDQAADCPGCDGALVKPTHNAEGAALGVDCSKAGVDSAAAEAHVHDVLGALNETLVAEWRRLAADHRSAAALNQPDAPSPLPSAPSTAPAAVTAPQGPRIEVRDGAEVTVDSYDTNGCQEEGPVHGGVCTVHIDGQHVCEDGPAAAPDRGLWHVLERWPIAPALPETPDPRWEPGAVWEHNGGRHRIGSALPSERPTHARFIGLLADVEFVSMTEANGWRFVPAKPSQVKQWQVWRCVGIDGELEVHYLRREDDPRDVGLRRLGTSGVSVRARAADMLGLKEWIFVRGPR